MKLWEMTWDQCCQAAAKGQSLSLWEGYCLARDKYWLDKRNQKVDLEAPEVERKIKPLYLDTLKTAYERREKYGITFPCEVIEEQIEFFRKIGADVDSLLGRHPACSPQQTGRLPRPQDMQDKQQSLDLFSSIAESCEA